MRSRPGFTLLELSISLVVMGVILVSLGSVLVLSAKALPSSSTSGVGAVPAQAGLDRLIAEARFATKVAEATPTALTFTVADRNGDLSPETIRYAWSGTAGAPLTRQYNGGPATPVIPAVASFSLGYLKQKHTQSSQTTTTTDSGEVMFANFSGWALLATNMTGNLSTVNWSAEAFTIDRVSIPSDSTRVAITKVSLKLRKPSGVTGGCVVGIYPPSSAGASTPGTTPIGTPYTVPDSALTTSFAWVDCPFTDVVITPAQRDLIIVVRGTAGTTTASLQYLNALTAPLDSTVYRYNTASGAAGSWQPALSLLNANDAYFTVYGSYQQQTTTTANVDTYTLSALTASLQPTGAGMPRFDTSIEALNDPSIPGP
jgi:prepilin-type N-terminal cleavage/methylation domain-containing protein